MQNVIINSTTCKVMYVTGSIFEPQHNVLPVMDELKSYVPHTLKDNVFGTNPETSLYHATM